MPKRCYGCRRNITRSRETIFTLWRRKHCLRWDTCSAVFFEPRHMGTHGWCQTGPRVSCCVAVVTIIAHTKMSTVQLAIIGISQTRCSRSRILVCEVGVRERWLTTARPPVACLPSPAGTEPEGTVNGSRPRSRSQFAGLAWWRGCR